MLRAATVIMFSKRGLDIGRVIEEQTQDRLDALKEVRVLVFLLYTVR
jgi:hypothetical protein